MTKIPVTAVAVVVLWIALSTIWMVGSGASQSVAAGSQVPAGHQPPQSCAMTTSMSDGANGNMAMTPGSGLSSPPQTKMQGANASISAGSTLPTPVQGIMTEPVPPMLALQELSPTPPAATDGMTRLQAVADRLAVAVDRLEAKSRIAVASVATPGIENQESTQPSPSWFSQFLSVFASGPIIGFALLLLLVLAATTRGRSALQGVMGWLQKSPTTQTAWNSASGQRFRAAVKLKQDQALTYLKAAGLDNPQGRAARWSRFSSQAERFQKGIITRSRPLLAQLGLGLQAALPSVNGGSASTRRMYGDVIHGTDANGKVLQAGVFEEGQVRAAAGLTLALGAVAFGYAYFAHIYAPIQVITTLFFFEFLIRVTAGIRYSPTGMIAHLMTRRHTPQLVSAKPKRFAWTLGLVMSLAMMIITNSGIRGPLPMSICLICLTLMWFEAVIGLCLGCEIHRLLVRRGWAEPDEDYEICANGACVVEARS